MTKEQNRRRYGLIVKRNRHGLTNDEASELAQLKKIARVHADRIAPLPKIPAKLKLSK